MSTSYKYKMGCHAQLARYPITETGLMCRMDNNVKFLKCSENSQLCANGQLMQMFNFCSCVGQC